MGEPSDHLFRKAVAKKGAKERSWHQAQVAKTSRGQRQCQPWWPSVQLRGGWEGHESCVTTAKHEGACCATPFLPSKSSPNFFCRLRKRTGESRLLRLPLGEPSDHLFRRAVAKKGAKERSWHQAQVAKTSRGQRQCQPWWPSAQLQPSLPGQSAARATSTER